MRACLPVVGSLPLMLMAWVWPQTALSQPTVPDGAALLARVRALAAPALAGRGNGAPEAAAVADTIARWFAAAGLVPAGDAGWFQEFALQGGDPVGCPARNVIGSLPGRGALAGRWLVLGAHHDHLGRVRGGGAQGAYYPGADDDASGVAVLVEVARLLARADASGAGGDARAVVCVAFAGEEDGLQGSAQFTREWPAPRDSLDVMVNLDTVGRLRGQRLYVAGVGTAAALPAVVDGVNAGHGLRLEVSRGGWEAGDHVSFSAAGVPIIFLTTGPHEQYHAVTDDWPLVEPGGLVAVAGFARDLVARLRGLAGRCAYVAEAATPPARRAPAGRSAADARAGRAWLGVIPDFVEGAGGVKLAGVMPGSPAAAAGLAGGDVLCVFDGRPVADLQAYTRELYAHAPGDTVLVAVKRGAELVQRRVVLEARR